MVYLNKLINRNSLIWRLRILSRQREIREKILDSRNKIHTKQEQNKESKTDFLEPPMYTGKPSTKFQQLKPQIFLSGAKNTNILVCGHLWIFWSVVSPVSLKLESCANLFNHLLTRNMWKDTWNLLDKLAGPASKFKCFWRAKCLRPTRLWILCNLRENSY